MEDSVSSFNKEEFLADQRRKCSHDSSTYFQVNKTITLGKIELSVQVYFNSLLIGPSSCHNAFRRSIQLAFMSDVTPQI